MTDPTLPPELAERIAALDATIARLETRIKFFLEDVGAAQIELRVAREVRDALVDVSPLWAQSAPEPQPAAAMTGPELIELAARVIRDGRQCGEASAPLTVPCPFCEWGPDDLTKYRDETGCIWLARAAVAALLAATREPTKAMIVAGENAMPFAGPTEQMWRAMHDALARELGVGDG